MNDTDEPDDRDDGDDRDGRDDAASRRADPVRTFAALPPARGGGFASSWWGRTWLKALEDTALDGQQLKRGRRLAREGRVGAVSVRPGRITAIVQGRDSTAYRSDVLLQQLTEEEWDRFLDMAVERSGHIAALLDREMPPDLVEDAAAAGVELLPGIGELEPECTCEAWDHCPHSGALCYQMARLLDQDPFVLLLMRGRDERRLLSELQLRSVALAARQAPEGPASPDAPDAPRSDRGGVRADEAFAAQDILPPLPAPPSLPAEPGPAPSLETGTGTGTGTGTSGDGYPVPGVDPAALEVLAADSAVRAYRMLAEALAVGHETRPVPAELTPEQDAVRLVADARPEARIATRIAAGSGRLPGELDSAVRAWQYGGTTALAVLEEEWEPGPEEAARARTLLAAAWEEGEHPQMRLRGAGSRWSVVGTGVQLRYGRDGRWWPYREEHGRWVPAGPADEDPAGALAGALPDRSPH